ncbi:MAG: CCA tRNA nucleotidyltransferase [Nitrospiraceae bacterium]|nr:MAG: CCA tRNA nucleotidyltransferase [Nitrospiraceae bacterium]
MTLFKKIFADPVNKWVFSYAKKEIFLVGGYIRDLLRGGIINKDKDYVLKDDIRKIALLASKKFKGTFVELKKNKTCRVALKNGQFLDFSRLTDSLFDDLSLRDFRINSIAWSPEQGLIDPLNGERDIRNKIIRVVDPENLRNDPLRILRAYRLSAQLGFTIDRYTRNYLGKYAVNLKDTTSERITEELFKLLICNNAYIYLTLLNKDNVLHEILDATTITLNHNIKTISKFDHFISRLQSGKFKKLYTSSISPVLSCPVGQGLDGFGLIRLSILLTVKNRKKEYSNATLKLSTSIAKRVCMLQEAIRISSGILSEAKLYNVFRITNECEIEAAVLLSVSRHRYVDKFIKRADDFIKMKRNPLLDGYDIQNILNINPSAIIGQIQDEIQKRRFLGIIRTKSQARHWIISNLT